MRTLPESVVQRKQFSFKIIIIMIYKNVIRSLKYETNNVLIECYKNPETLEIDMRAPKVSRFKVPAILGGNRGKMRPVLLKAGALPDPARL